MSEAAMTYLIIIGCDIASKCVPLSKQTLVSNTKFLKQIDKKKSIGYQNKWTEYSVY